MSTSGSDIEDGVDHEITLSDNEEISNMDMDVSTSTSHGSSTGRYTGGTKSAVWEYFTYDDTKQKSECRLCKHWVPGKRPGELKKHIKSKAKKCLKHKSALQKINSSMAEKRSVIPPSKGTSSGGTQITWKEAMAKLSHYEKDSAKYQELLKSLGILFAAHSLPHLLVESNEFRDFIRKLDPRFDLPNRRKLSTIISDLFDKMKEQLKIELKDTKVSVILDIWSRRGLTESYLGVLVQYFCSKSGQVKKALIGLRKMIGSHTGDNIKAMLQLVLDEWEIAEGNILYFVTDNGSNVVKALREYMTAISVEDHEEEDDQNTGMSAIDPNLDDTYDMVAADAIEFDIAEREQNGAFSYSKRIPCIAHLLACVVRKCIDGSPDLKPALSDATHLIRKINMSGLLKEQLLAYNGKGLLSPSATRWLFTYDMLARLIESKAAVEKVILENNLEAT